MGNVLHFHPDYGLAVYNSTTSPVPDGAPLISPLANLSRLSFHSELRYPRWIPAKIVTGSASIPAKSSNTRFSGSVDLYAHGMGDVPVVFGTITGISHTYASGEPGTNNTRVFPTTPLPWLGTVPVLGQAYTASFNPPTAGYAVKGVHFAALAATTTHVVMRYMGFNALGSGDKTGATSISYKIYVLDTTLETDNFDGDPAQPLLKIEGDGRVRVGRGKFDTDFYYLKQGSAVDPVELAVGKTMDVVGSMTDASPDGLFTAEWGFRFKVGSSSLEYYNTAGSTFAATTETAGF